MIASKIIPGYRLVKTNRGDTLQMVAVRELGDAARWYDLADFNALSPPYLVDDPTLVGPRVLLTGATLKIPSTSAMVIQDEASNDLFGVDIYLNNGLLDDADGDFATIGGEANLRQALEDVLMTDPGELLYHPAYGCSTRNFIGAANTSANGLVAGALVKRAVQADPRIADVIDASATEAGDTLRIEVTAEAINAVPISVSI